MKFTVSSSSLSNRLQAISRVINAKNTMAILDCFYFELHQGVLTITASDTENVVQTKVETTENDMDGTFAIPAKTMLDILKEIPEQPLQFDIDTATLAINVKYLNGIYNLVGQDPDAYPMEVPMNDQNTQVSLEGSMLLNEINRTLFAAADDELRPVMNGLFFDFEPDAVTFVASDGHKLVRSKSLLTTGLEERKSFILPKKPASLLKNLLAKEQGNISIAFDERFASFESTEFSLICRLIDGRYPSYNSVIPQNNPYQITVDRQMMIGVLRRVSIFSSQASSLIKMRLLPDQIVVSAQDIDFSTSAEESLICQYNGNEMSIGFKSSFLIDILNNIPSSEVIFQLADPSRAGVIIPSEQNENEDLLMLLMPMMLND